MRRNVIDRSTAAILKKDFSSALYGVSLALEAGLLYCGFTFAMADEIPPYYRLIGVAVILPSAAVAAWWGGQLSLRRKGEIRQHPMLLVSTLPVRILMGALVAAIIVSILALTGSL